MLPVIPNRKVPARLSKISLTGLAASDVNGGLLSANAATRLQSRHVPQALTSIFSKRGQLRAFDMVDNIVNNRLLTRPEAVLCRQPGRRSA